MQSSVPGFGVFHLALWKRQLGELGPVFFHQDLNQIRSTAQNSLAQRQQGNIYTLWSAVHGIHVHHPLL
jgi:hypothetical protein